jgi:hypothetical protein
MNKPRQLKEFAANAEKTACRERAIQDEVDCADKAREARGKKSEPSQTGARPCPTSFPKQHLEVQT